MLTVAALCLIATILTVAKDASGAAPNEYNCVVKNQGMRIHEGSSHTRYDCVDSGCHNTCRGGQCVAYVKCNCNRNGRCVPNTSCWRPGQRVKVAGGKCNGNIAPKTAIATFDSKGRYSEHAAVFIKCLSDSSVQVYDQWCGKSAGYTTYDSSHRFFSAFATITSPGCSDPASCPCRVEKSGPTNCAASYPQCKRKRFWEVIDSINEVSSNMEQAKARFED